MTRVVRFVQRTGGMLCRPRTTMRSLESEEGRRDGLWLGLAYVLGGHLQPFIEGLATLVAVRNLNGVLMFLAAFGVLLPPLLASIAAESIIGADRGRRHGLCLVPLVAISIVAQALPRLGVEAFGPRWLPAVVGVVASVGLAVWVRGRGPAAEPLGRRSHRSFERFSRVLGGLVLASALALGGSDLRRGVAEWSSLGPLPPGEEVPTFRVLALDGRVLRADALVGQVSVVTFWATWCGVCVGELRDLDALAASPAHRSVQFLAINREGGNRAPEQTFRLVEDFARRHGLQQLSFALDDGTMARTFGVGPIPHTVIFDARGRVRHVHQGRVMSSTLQREIEALLP